MESIPKQNVFQDSNIDTLYKEKQLSRFDYVVEKIRDQFRILQDACSEMYDPRYLAFLVDHIKHYAQKYPNKISDIKTQEDYNVELSNYEHWGLEQCSKWKVTQIRNEIIRYDSETDFIHYLQTTVKENAENILSDDRFLKAQYEPYKTVLDEYKERAKLTTIQPEPAKVQTPPKSKRGRKPANYTVTKEIENEIKSIFEILEKMKVAGKTLSHEQLTKSDISSHCDELKTLFEGFGAWNPFLKKHISTKLQKYFGNAIATKTDGETLFEGEKGCFAK